MGSPVEVHNSVRGASPWARARRWLKARGDDAGRFLFGADVFISYSRADAYDYAGRLAALLGRQGLSVYLDQAGSEPGKDVPRSVLRAVRTARVFVLLASPAAMASPAVALEARSFPSVRPIVPVALGTLASDWPAWAGLVTGLAVAAEGEEAVRTGTPSAGVVERVALAVGRWRQMRRIRAAALGATALLAALLIGMAVVGRQFAQTSLALRASGQQLTALDARLGEAARQLASAEQSYAASRVRLEALQTQIVAREAELQAATARLDTAQRARAAQVAATAEVWDFFETGIQDLYRQPSLACDSRKLVLQPPLSIYFFSDRAKVSDKGSALLDALADCYLKLADPPALLIAGSLSARRRNASASGMVQEGLGAGSSAYDQALGQRQAEAVKRYLVARGIPAERMLAQSRGHEASESFALAVMNNRVAISLQPRR